MSILRWLSIPSLLTAFVGAPVYWAFPYELPAARGTGIILGWSGYGLLLGSLLLMLRETVLARALGGLDRMYLWHHRTGVVAYVLLLTHPLALAAAAWTESPLLAWETLSPLAEGAAERLGWISLLLLMLGLATTFSRSIGYRRWRWLHLSLAAGVVTGLAHLWQLGIDEPLSPVLGLTLVILVWRLAREDTGLSAQPYVVTATTPVARDLVEITLRPLARPIVSSAGQFALVAFFSGPRFRGCGEYHPFTLSAVGNDGQLRIAVKALGDCTRHLQSIEPGVAARVDGGFGSAFAERTAVPQLWLAGGVGITPFLGLLRAGPVSEPTTLIYLYRNEGDAAFLAELQVLAAADPKLSLRAVATGDDAVNFVSLLSEATPLGRRECYLCGPPGMIAAAQKQLRQMGVEARRIHCERFGFR